MHVLTSVNVGFQNTGHVQVAAWVTGSCIACQVEGSELQVLLTSSAHALRFISTEVLLKYLHSKFTTIISRCGGTDVAVLRNNGEAITPLQQVLLTMKRHDQGPH